MNLTDPFQITVRDTVKELAEAEGWEFQSGDGNGDNAKQINLCEDMINAGITSPYSLYSENLVTFGESDFNQAEAAGFINIWGLPTKVQALREQGKL